MASAQKKLLEERMKICNILWNAGIKVRKRGYTYMYVLFCLWEIQAEMSYKENPRFLDQIQYCEREKVPFMVIVGVDEKDKGGVKIRNVRSQTEVSVL